MPTIRHWQQQPHWRVTLKDWPALSLMGSPEAKGNRAVASIQEVDGIKEVEANKELQEADPLTGGPPREACKKVGSIAQS